MKKLLSIVVTIGMLICAVGFWVVGGTQFLKLQAGSRELGPEESFAQAQGEYVSYQAAYPVASCVAAYYSGDSDRVEKRGYVVYDAQRQAFLYVIVPDQKKRELEDLLWNLHLAAEMRTDEDMEPYTVKGSIEPLEGSRDHIYAALEESAVIRNYQALWGDETSRNTYFGDSYGEVLGQMGGSLDQLLQQADWYQMESNVVNGMKTMDIWVCILAAGLSFLIFLVRLVSLFLPGGKKAVAELAPSGSRMALFYSRQLEMAQEWHVFSRNRGCRMIYLTFIGCVVVLTGIGVIGKMPFGRLVGFYVALGVLLGEVFGILSWWAVKGQSNVGKLMKKLSQGIGKQLPATQIQEEFAEDILAAGPEWEYKEKTKEGMLWGTLGSRYWTVLHATGRVILIDSQKLRKIETEAISGQVRSGKVRINYTSYAAHFFYKSGTQKEQPDETVTFNVQDNIGDFMLLARKRVGDCVEFSAR